MRPLRSAHALLVTAALVAATPVMAGDDAQHDVPPSIGAPTSGLALVPETWHYRPRPAPIAIPSAASSDGAVGTQAGTESLRSLSVGYVADRESLVNTVKSRRGLPLLTLWEGAGRCLFFGINDRGRAGFSFVRLRSLVPRRDEDTGVAALYAELTGERRATFPQPPALIAHRVR